MWIEFFWGPWNIETFNERKRQGIGTGTQRYFKNMTTFERYSIFETLKSKCMPWLRNNSLLKTVVELCILYNVLRVYILNYGILPVIWPLLSSRTNTNKINSVTRGAWRVCYNITKFPNLKGHFDLTSLHSFFFVYIILKGVDSTIIINSN